MEDNKIITESELILPALYIIEYRGEATTSDLIKELTSVFNPTGEDAEILKGRSDTKFSQKVRNLVSHRDTNHMLEYTEFNNGIYTLTDEGRRQVDANRSELDYMFAHKFSYDDNATLALILSEGKNVKLYDDDTIIYEGKVEEKKVAIRNRSQKLRDEAIYFYSQNGGLKCCICGFSFEETYGDLGKGYIEIHHEKPIFQYDEIGTEQFMQDALQNVKPVCANCHRMLHRDSKHPLAISELVEIIKPSK